MKILSLMALTSLSLFTLAGDDTTEARKTAAKKYMEVVGMERIIEDTSKAMAAQMPEAERVKFLEYMKVADWSKVLEASIDGMAKHFTVKEIKALEAFYGSAEGKSIMTKFPTYMNDMMPIVQEETMTMLKKYMVDKSKEQYKSESQ